MKITINNPDGLNLFLILAYVKTILEKEFDLGGVYTYRDLGIEHIIDKDEYIFNVRKR